jgi:hypothetical protein
VPLVQQALQVQLVQQAQVSLDQQVQLVRLVRQAQQVHKEQQFKFLAPTQLSVRCRLPTLQVLLAMDTS